MVQSLVSVFMGENYDIWKIDANVVTLVRIVGCCRSRFYIANYESANIGAKRAIN